MPASSITNPGLAAQIVDTLTKQYGLHPGFRPVHAKGLMCSGVFTPSPEAAKLTRAPHATRPFTLVTVRYSDSSGMPSISDSAPGPRGMAVRFHLAEHDHTDIVAHSTNGFPVHTADEFLELTRAAIAFGEGHPEALGAFLASHPSAKSFIEAPKPVPASFAREAYFAVTSFKFTNAAGASRHGRFRVRPEDGTEYLSDQEATAKSKDFLFDEITKRLNKGPVRLGVFVQLAEPGDDVTDATVTWPQNRPEIPFGAISLTARIDDQVPERRKIIFDPLPRVDGIDSSGDPLTGVRADVYLVSGRRRRSASTEGAVLPTHDQIQQRAYELFLARGREHGKDLEDWLVAEAELTRDMAHTPEAGAIRAAGKSRAAKLGGSPAQ